MFPRLYSISVLLISMPVTISLSTAQSSQNVEPPPQVTQIIGSQVTGAPQPRAFQFSTAELDEDGNIVLSRIESSFTTRFSQSRELKEGQRAYRTRGNVTQNYVVQVPYIEMVEGKPVAKMRTETKTRTIPNAHVWKVVNEDGTEVERLTRISTTFKADQIACFDVSGIRISAEAIKGRLEERTPVIVVGDATAIAPYFKQILRPEAIFMLQPKKKGLKTETKDVSD